MKEWLHISISLLLLISHLGLTVGTHSCGGEIVSSEFVFTNIDLDCCADKMMACEEEKSHGEDLFKDVPCCENHYTTIDVVDDFLKSSTQISHNVISSAFVFTILNSKLFQKATTNFYTDYSPPLLKKEIQSLFQVFII